MKHFFKTGKYKLCGNLSKNNNSNKVQPVEHFYQIEGPSTTNNGHIINKPSATTSRGSADDVTPCLRFSNKTAYAMIRMDTSSAGFPTEILPFESKILNFDQFQNSMSSTYQIKVDVNGETRSFEFEVKVTKNVDRYELLVNWKDLTDLAEIQLKPDQTSSNQSIQVTTAETVVEIIA